jgi:predicted MFS family arabinose efflux permease
MKKEDLTPTARWMILGGAALMLTLAMGMRQSMGLFQPHMIRSIGITASDFSLAIAIQNIVWGLTQPFAGALVDRYGARWVCTTGVLIYGIGMLTTAFATSALAVTVGVGLCVGIALSCTASNPVMAITSRTVSAARRSFAMGAVSSAGSLGLMFTSPLAQGLIVSEGWQIAMLAFFAIAVVMVPAAFMAGGADRIEVPRAAGPDQSVLQAVREATSHSGYIVMAIAFFVCGLQLVFLTTHLPTYLDLCGIDPSVTAAALALIGLFNAIGSLVFGWLGGLYSKHLLLGGIYVTRSLLITAYFLTTPTPTTTLLFAAAMGSLWLGVVPLLNGLVIHLFGLRYVATLAGVAFLSHQLGSFVGAYGGGLIYTTLGSYEWAWKGAVIIGLIAGLAQMTMNTRPVERMRTASASPAGSGA